MFRPEKVIYWEPKFVPSDHDSFIDGIPRDEAMSASVPDMVRASLLAVPDPEPER